MKSPRRLLVCFALGWALAASAGTYNDVLSIGDAAPRWENLTGTDDQNHALSDFQSDVLVIVFTCNSCPYAVDYEQRLVAFARDIRESKTSVTLVAINVNNIEEDQLPAMKKRAEKAGFNFDYLHDPTQKTAKDYGAIRTPEFFVFNKARKLVYTGAMDDSADPAKVTKQYLRDAVQATLRDSDVPLAETPPVGCAIRFDRPKRTRKPPQ